MSSTFFSFYGDAKCFVGGPGNSFFLSDRHSSLALITPIHYNKEAKPGRENRTKEQDNFEFLSGGSHASCLRRRQGYPHTVTISEMTTNNRRPSPHHTERARGRVGGRGGRGLPLWCSQSIWIFNYWYSCEPVYSVQ